MNEQIDPRFEDLRLLASNWSERGLLLCTIGKKLFGEGKQGDPVSAIGVAFLECANGVTKSLPAAPQILNFREFELKDGGRLLLSEVLDVVDITTICDASQVFMVTASNQVIRATDQRMLDEGSVTHLGRSE